MSPLSNFPSTDTLTLLVDYKPHLSLLCLEMSSISLFHCNRAELHCNHLEYYHFNKCQNNLSLIAETPGQAVLVKAGRTPSLIFRL